MKTLIRNSRFLTVILLGALCVCVPGAATPSDKDKVSVDTIVAKHLESIGPAHARSAIRSHFITGPSVATLRMGGNGKASGKAVLVSESNKSMISMNFGDIEYPRERVGFDGSAITVSNVKPNTRSLLGHFFLNHSVIFKQGLMGGTLTTAWPLLDLQAKRPYLEYAGTSRVRDHDAYQVRYLPRKGSDLTIVLFFDTQTHQHIRTEYRRVIAPNMVSTRPEASSGLRESRYKLLEDFSDFKREGELTLPHSYNIQLTVDNVMYDWKLDLKQFGFNLPIDPKEFKVPPY